MDKLSKNEIIASSSGWVASLLNFLPGVGAGYLYQRRWLPYFLTTGAVTAWFIIGIFLQGDKEPSQREQLLGISGLFFISVITVIESNLSYRKAIKKSNLKKEEIKSSTNRGWFK